MKNELYIPLIIFALTLVFGIICLMVYLSDGNTYWIKKKLKIGALLLTFNGIVYGTSGQEAIGGCYIEPSKPTRKIFIGPILNHYLLTLKNVQLQSDYNYNSKNIPVIKGNGYGIGLSYEYSLGSLEDSVEELFFSTFVINVLYDYKSARNSRNIELFKLEEPNGDIVEKYSKLELDYDFSYLTFDILYKQNFSINFPLGIVGGFYFSVPISQNVKETLILPKSESSVESDKHEKINKIINERTILYDDEIKEFSTIDIGAKLIIQYEVFFDASYMTPSVGWTYPFTKIVHDTDWKMSTYFVSVSWRFAI